MGSSLSSTPQNRLYHGAGFPQRRTGNEERNFSQSLIPRNSLKIILLAELRDFYPVLVAWFKTKNVSCVPSRLGPSFVSNGTGKRGVDPKYRIKHLRDGRKKSGRRPAPEGSGIEDRMKTKDSGRKWMWWFLGVLAALQLYFVRELLAAFALFALGFAAVAFVIISLYMLQKGWEVAVGRVADSNHPVVNLARRGVSAVEDMARRPLRRPGSAAPRTV